MRIEAMTKTRKHLAKRFMKLYRLYRYKKFGEPFDESQHTWNLDDSDEFGFNKVYIPKNLQDSEQEIYNRIKELQRALGGKKDKSPGRNSISDLHTVKEDYDDEEDDDINGEAIDPNLNPAKFARSKGEYDDHVLKVIESSVIVSELKLYMQNVNKVKNFLLMVIQRNRFLKKRAAINLLQRYSKSYLSWKDSRKELVEERDFKKVEALKFFIKKASDV